jgi:CheY-like chemotaxis protein
LTATNGRDAIACYAQHQDQIHIVLIDMMMPEQDGPMTIRALQDMNPQVKVIATSRLARQYRQSLQALGITTMLTKPFTTAELLQSLTKNNGPTHQRSPDNQS